MDGHSWNHHCLLMLYLSIIVFFAQTRHLRVSFIREYLLQHNEFQQSFAEDVVITAMVVALYSLSVVLVRNGVL